MTTRIERSAGSLSVIIPDAIAVEANLVESSEVNIAVSDGSLVIGRSPRMKHDLDALLATITDEKLHPEIDFGKPVGLEVVL